MGLQGRPPPGRKLRRGVLWRALGPGGGRWGKGGSPPCAQQPRLWALPQEAGWGREDPSGRLVHPESYRKGTGAERGHVQHRVPAARPEAGGGGGRGTEERGAQLLVHTRWQHVQGMRAGPVWHRAAQVGLGEGRRAPVLHHVGPACHLSGPWQSQDRYQEQTGSPSTAAELYWDRTNTPSFSVVGSRVHRTLPHRDPP